MGDWLNYPINYAVHCFVHVHVIVSSTHCSGTSLLWTVLISEVSSFQE